MLPRNQESAFRVYELNPSARFIECDRCGDLFTELDIKDIGDLFCCRNCKHHYPFTEGKLCDCCHLVKMDRPSVCLKNATMEIWNSEEN